MLVGQTSALEITLEVTLVSYTRKLNSLSHFLHKQKAIRNSLNHYRLKQSKVLTLKHDIIQYSASVQFCPGYNSSNVFDLLSHAWYLTAKIVIIITFYSSSCLGQETAKEPFGLRVKLPPAHLSTTHGVGFTQSL